MSEQSLDESMEETLAEIKGRAEEEVEEETTDEVIDEPVTEVEAPVEEPVSETPAEEVEEEPAEEPVFEDPSIANPPTTWRAGPKSKWAALDPEVRAEIRKRELDVSNGFSQYKQKVDSFNEMEAVLKPYEAMIQAENSTANDVISSMMKSAYILRQGQMGQKVQMIGQLAQDYGFINQLRAYLTQGAIPQPQQPRGMSADEVRTLLQQDRQESEQKRQDYEVTQQVSSFQNAQNEDGSLLYPYFENVRSLMAAMIEANPSLGLEDAYNNALWASDETRPFVEQQTSSQSQAKAHTEKAKKASQANVRKKSSHAAEQPEPTGSVEDTMAETMRKIKSRNN